MKPGCKYTHHLCFDGLYVTDGAISNYAGSCLLPFGCSLCQAGFNLSGKAFQHRLHVGDCIFPEFIAAAECPLAFIRHTTTSSSIRDQHR